MYDRDLFQLICVFFDKFFLFIPFYFTCYYVLAITDVMYNSLSVLIKIAFLIENNLLSFTIVHSIIFKKL